MQETGNANVKNESINEMKSMQEQGRTTQKIVTVRHESRMKEGLGASHIVVSEEQFKQVRMEQLTSINLLNSSGNVLLSAMNSMIPPEGSERVMGEYTAQGVRQIAKSICDIVQTKANVVRQMYAISRDEF